MDKINLNKSHFKTIVVGLDFSPYSKTVLKQAQFLSEKFGARLIVVYALTNYALIAGEMGTFDWEDDIIAPAEKEILKFYKLDSTSVKVIVSLKKAFDAITSAANDNPSPLIVVGHKGSNSIWGRFFIGSTAEQLAIHSRFPVWIHRGSKISTGEKFLIPCDFSERTINSIKEAVSLGKTNAKYSLFHVIEKIFPILDAKVWNQMQSSQKSKLQSNLKRFEKLYPTFIVKNQSGNPEQLIQKQSSGFDLIVMSPHEREGLFSSLGSVTAKVVRSGKVPVLIVH